MWLLVNQTKPTCFVLKLVSFNCRQLQIRERAIGQLQNNSANDEVLITINRAIKYKIFHCVNYFIYFWITSIVYFYLFVVFDAFWKLYEVYRILDNKSHVL